MADRSGLSQEITSLIINDLIYDKNLYIRGGEKAPHVVYQPFFDFENDQIGLSEKIIQNSNMERNIWSLLSVIRPSVFNDLTGKKEKYWIDSEFSAIAQSLGLKLFPNIEYKSKEYEGDIDLLIIDEKLKFGLVAELKWLTSSDKPSGVKDDDKTINVGVEQADRATKWISLYLEVLSQKIKIDINILRDITFRPIVITKDDLPSGFGSKCKVPVITENLFKWIIIYPHHRNLSELWEVAQKMNFLPKEGIHFRTVSHSIKWFNLLFKCKDVSHEKLEHWTPEKDIVL